MRCYLKRDDLDLVGVDVDDVADLGGRVGVGGGHSGSGTSLATGGSLAQKSAEHFTSLAFYATWWQNLSLFLQLKKCLNFTFFRTYPTFLFLLLPLCRPI